MFLRFPFGEKLRSQGSSEFIAIALLFALSLSSLNADLLIILLKGCQVLTCLRELSFFHSFPDIPVHEGTFGVHEVELVVDAREDLCDGRGVADHADSTHYLGEVTTRHHSWRLVVDATLEACGRPIHKLDRTLRLDGGDGCVYIFWHHVSTVHEAAS